MLRTQLSAVAAQTADESRLSANAALQADAFVAMRADLTEAKQPLVEAMATVSVVRGKRAPSPDPDTEQITTNTIGAKAQNTGFDAAPNIHNAWCACSIALGGSS